MRYINKLGVVVFLLLLSITSGYSQITRAVVNPSFEEPVITTNYVQTHHDNVTFWKTSASDSKIEIWQSGFLSVPSQAGNQHIEINATQEATVYQKFCVENGETMTWSFYHRARAGTDVINLTIGGDDQGDFSSTTAGWNHFTGSFTATSDGEHLLEFSAVSTGSGNNTVGNFLDNITVGGLVTYVEFGKVAYADSESGGSDIPQLLLLGDLATATTVEVTVVGGTATSGDDFSSTTTVTIPAGLYDATLATAIPINLSITDNAIFEGDETIDFKITAVGAGLKNKSTSVCSQPGVDLTTYTISEDDFPNLTVEKIVSPTGNVAPGDELTYTITIENVGTDGAGNIKVTDLLPTGLTYVNGSASATYLGNVPSSFTHTFTPTNQTFNNAGLTQSYTVTTADVPAGATITSYSYDVTVSTTDWLSEITLVANHPGGSSNGSSFGGDVAGNNVNQAGNGPVPGSPSALGTYEFVWGDVNNFGTNTVNTSSFTINYTSSGMVTNAVNAPGNMIVAGDGIDLLAGNTMTVTLKATVDVGATGVLTNNVTVGADLTAEVSDAVSNTVPVPNTAPIAKDNTYTVDEDNTLTKNVITDTDGTDGTDSDSENNTLTVTQFVVDGQTKTAGQTATLTGKGTVKIESDGTLTFVPVADYNGTVPEITYTLSDGNLTDEAKVNITVSPVNDAPIAKDNTYTVDEDNALTKNVITDTDGTDGTDSDLEGNTLTVTQFVVDGQTKTVGQTATLVGKGTVKIESDGTLTFVPVADYNGTVPEITYTLSDGNLTDEAKVNITVSPVNDAPIAKDNTYTVDEDNTLTKNVITDTDGTDGTDSDLEGNTLTVTQFVVDGQTKTAGQTATLTGKGTVKIESDGTLTFVPVADYNGTVPEITYTLSDGNLTDEAKVNITVSPVNDAPIAKDNTYTVDEDNTLTKNVITDTDGTDGTDSDSENNTLTVTQFVVDGQTKTAGQTATLTGKGTVKIESDGTLTFVPVADYNGTVPEITYTLSDGNLTDEAKVNITVSPVNDAPIAKDNTYTVDEDNTLTKNVITDTDGTDGTDSDSENNTLTVTQFVVDGQTKTAGQTATLTGKGTVKIESDGTLTFVPVADYNGTVPEITYTLSDGNLTDEAKVNITVSPVNTAPIAKDNTYTVDEDNTLTKNVITDTDGTDGTDSDSENNTLTVTQFVVDGQTKTAGQTATLTGKGTVKIESDGTLTFVPVADYNGTVPEITYTLSDGNLTDEAKVNITVSPVNDAPIAKDNTYTVDEDNALTKNVITDTDGTDGTDSDSENNTLTVTQFVVDGQTKTAGQTATITGKGTVKIESDGTLTFVPVADYNGTVPEITYTLSDGNLTDEAKVNITVSPVNDAPIAKDNTYTVDEDNTLTKNVITDTDGTDGTDSDSENNTLTVTQFVVDGQTKTAGQTATLTGKGTVKIESDGTLTFVPVADYNGTVPEITYTLSDGNLTDEAKVNITVSPVNDAPIAKDNTYTVDEDNTLTKNVITDTDGTDGTDSDSENNTLTVTQFVVDGQTKTAGQTATLTGKGTVKIESDGTLTFVPVADYNGTVPEITYTLSDGNLTDEAKVNITVSPVNDAPIAKDNTYTVDEDNTLTKNVITDTDGTDGTDSDSENNTLTVTQFVVDGQTKTAGQTATLTGKGTVKIESDGTLTFVPVADYNGTVPEITYTLSDGNLTDEAKVNITVSPVNDAPIAKDNTYTVDEDNALTKNVITDADGTDGTDSDSENNTLTVTQFVVDGQTKTAGQTATLTGKGTVKIESDGTLTFVPVADYNGTVPEITYTLSDGNLTDEAKVNITVSPVNDAPIAKDNTYTVDEDNTLTKNVITDTDGTDGTDSDSENNTLTVTQFVVDGQTKTAGQTATLTGKGTVKIESDGTLTFVPVADYNGTVPEITYTLSDGNLTDEAKVNITVSPVNDAPIAKDNTYTVDEDNALTKNVITDADGTDGTDSDSENNTLTVTQFVVDGQTKTAGQTATLTGKGTVKIESDGTLTFVPVADYNGTVPEITYTLSDGNLTDEAKVNITVHAVNDAPIAKDNTYTVDEDNTLTKNVITDTDGTDGTDSDSENNTLAVTQFVVDGQTKTAGQTATITGKGTVKIESDGTLTFIPVADFNGTVPEITYTLSDGNLTDEAKVKITVSPVNDAPKQGNEVLLVAKDEPNPTTSVNLIGNNGDIDGTPVKVTSVVSSSGNGTTTVTNGGTTIAYTPMIGFVGIDTVIYTVCDEDLPTPSCVNDTLFVTVSSTPNTAPIAKDNTYTVDEDNTLTKNVITDTDGTDGTDSDSENNTLAVTQFVVDGQTKTVGQTATLVGKGTVKIESDGTLTFVPVADYNGLVPEITYTLSDGNLTDEAKVNITVDPVNDAPIAKDNTYTVDEDNALTKNVITDTDGTDGTDSDSENNTLAVTQFVVDGQTKTAGQTATITGKGTVKIESDGTLTFIPVADFNGTVPEITYTLSDGNLTDEAKVNITVSPVNDAPKQGNEVLLVAKDEPNPTTSVNLIGNNGDIDGTPVKVTGVISTTGNGTTSVTNGGTTLDYTPAVGFVGIDTVVYTVCDEDLPSPSCVNDTLFVTVSATLGVSMTVSDVTITEADAGTTNANVTVTLSSVAPVGGTTVLYDLVDNTAVGGVDYIKQSGRVKIPGRADNSNDSYSCDWRYECRTNRVFHSKCKRRPCCGW